MAAPRGEFTSRFGFLMAASGSAVGLGNIWGFPTNAATNGGAAFLFVYLILAFALAYPALMAELIIGRYARANAVTALRSISTGNKSRILALMVGFAGIITVCFILSFYAIVSGWMIAFFFDPLARMAGMNGLAQWLTQDGVLRDSLFVIIFMLAPDPSDKYAKRKPQKRLTNFCRVGNNHIEQGIKVKHNNQCN